MKTLKFLSILLLSASFVMLTGCSDDDPPAADPLVMVKGKVTYTNAAGAATNAPGAVIYLTETSTSTRISAFSDANGDYSYANVVPGDYTLTASYFTDNKNIAGRFNGLTFATLTPIAITVGSTDVTTDIALATTGQTGIEALSFDYSWDGNAYVQAGTWTYDATHTVVNFEFPYRGNINSDFNGVFHQASKVKINFDPNNLAASTVDVEIDVASFDTRSPGGRDPVTTVDYRPLFAPTTMFKHLGCVMGTFGITTDNAPPTVDVPQPMTDTKRYAKFVSTSIAKLGDGYVAKGNLTFLGITKSTDIWFKIAPPWTDTSNNRKYSGFEGRFMMNAKADFGVNSSSVNDTPVKIQISLIGYKTP